jgi:hypothetical protein
MKIALLLTEKQRESILYQQYNGPDYIFNPRLDENYNWVIEKTEADNCTNNEFYWLNFLPQIEFKPLKCATLTEEQKDLLEGQYYNDTNKFNIIQDKNYNFVITQEQYINCTNHDFLWVKALPKIEYVPLYNYVALLTEQQRDFLGGKQFEPDSYYGPFQDADDNWAIGLVEYYKSSGIMSWVKTLPLIPHKPKTTNNNG